MWPRLWHFSSPTKPASSPAPPWTLTAGCSCDEAEASLPHCRITRRDLEMSEESHQAGAPEKHRVLFCIGVLQANFDAPREELADLLAVLKREFGDLRGRYGIEVLGTFDDDML